MPTTIIDPLVWRVTETEFPSPFCSFTALPGSAHSLFDGTPQRMTAVGGGINHISALPGGVLHHIIVFLQADEHAHWQWRHLWMSVPILRLIDLCTPAVTH
jgi:hypothetical protein